MTKKKLIQDLNYIENKRLEMIDCKDLWKDKFLYRVIFAILEIQWDILQHIRRKDFNL